MRFERPNILASSISIILGLLVLGLTILINILTNSDLSWEAITLLAAWAAIASFLLIRFSVDQFIYNKVKAIYKSIHEFKADNNNNIDRNEAVSSFNLDMAIREVSEWAEQRRNEIQELKERETFRREFIGNISHELKTPVFNMQGYLLTLLDGALNDPEINCKYLKRANKSVDRMIDIIEDLETISDLESNKLKLNLTSFDIVDLTSEIFELLEDKISKRKMNLKLKKDYDKSIEVFADRDKIERVIFNLIINAIKYGKDKGKVEVHFYDMQNDVLIEVSDNGIGIPQEDISHIFERFYRVDKSRSRKAGGTGLGLSIAKHILETHKQSIKVKSIENVGSTFSFMLKKGK